MSARCSVVWLRRYPDCPSSTSFPVTREPFVMPRHNDVSEADGGDFSIRECAGHILRPALYTLGFVIGVAALWMLTSFLSAGSASAAPAGGHIIGKPGAVAVV